MCSLNMAYQLFVFLLTVLSFVSCNKFIKIFSDFKNDNDVSFFKKTFPWVVENIGRDIYFQFLFKDPKEKSGRRQCTLIQLELNPYLQAEYLSCEANGNTDCIKTLPLDNYRLNYCIRTKARYLARRAEYEFKRFSIDITPTMAMPRRQILKNVGPEELLKKICALYIENRKPQGCLQPSPIPDQSNSSSTSKPDQESKPDNTTEPKKDAESKTENTLTPDKDKNSTNNSDPQQQESDKPNENQTSETSSESNEKKESKVHKRELTTGFDTDYYFDLDNTKELDEYELGQQTEEEIKS